MYPLPTCPDLRVGAREGGAGKAGVHQNRFELHFDDESFLVPSLPKQASSADQIIRASFLEEAFLLSWESLGKWLLHQI